MQCLAMFVGVFSLVVMGASASEENPNHVFHTPHAHKHGPKCGHKSVKHGDHIDYIHDGHYHAIHEDHCDEHGLVAAKKKEREIASNYHRIVTEHSHKHGANCGHKSVKHGNHVDYLHDGDFHAADGDHYDDHGIAPEKHTARK